MTWIEAVVGLLVLITVLHVLLTVALIRRVAQLAGGQQVARSGPQIATLLEPILARTLDGEEIEGVVDLSGAVVAVLSQSCHSCEAAAGKLAAAVQGGEVTGRVVALVVAADQTAPAYAHELAGSAEVYVLDSLGHPLIRQHGISIFPYYLRTDESALVRAAGPDLREVAGVAHTAP